MRVPSMSRSMSLVAVLVLVAGCGAEPAPEPAEPDAESAEHDAESDAQDDAATESAEEPVLEVVATVAPVADLVAMVGGERVAVDSLVPPGADSHTYEPRPGDVTSLADADAYLGVGLDLNAGAVELAREHLDDERVILLGERHLDDEELVFDHVHDDEDGHSHDDGAGPNPHVWTGLQTAMSLVDGIVEELAALDPDGAEVYADRAEEARAQLQDLDDEITEAMATIPEENRVLVVYHDAWSYLARDHDLEMVTAVQPSDYSEPSAGEVRDIIDLLREQEAPALFGSEVFPSDVLDAISEETGATYVGDLADDVLPGEPGDPEHSYPGLMRRNAALVVDGLGGDASGL